ncbi:MAG: leucyl/phenylalanyl-tRNA--protein transferase, partial [Xanthomonadales bacterium]|nr:leucyl/phenylalanyl-tRNA--protein transferase [Xanthomonadales bacterium]
VLVPGEVYLSRRTRRRYNSGRYRLSLDQAFAEVMAACAEPRAGESGTWITRDMLRAYRQLHEQGAAHSLEVWEGDELAGGIYGLSLGSVFFGESMFSRRTDGSKLALVALCRLLVRWGFALLDCQVGNPHLYRMGAQEITREGFELTLARNVDRPPSPRAWRESADFEDRW